MRITNNMMQSSFLSNLSAANERLYEKEIKVTTNKDINKPSDDPIGTVKSLTIRKKIDEITQYQKNISNSKTILNDTNTAVSQVADIMGQISAINTQGASGAYDENDRESLAQQANQLLDELFSTANTKTDSGYVFQVQMPIPPRILQYVMKTVK